MLGPNGCGKSTLLRTLAGLQPALSGELGISKDEIALVLTERLSLDNTTVHDVVAMGRYPYTSFLGGLSAYDESIIHDALVAVGLSCEMAESLFNDHSDGEKQRILIAKAIGQQTPIMDLPNRIRILQLLRRLAREQKKTILISTHELDLAIQLSDRILLMSEKGLLLDTAANLREADAFSLAFGMDIFHPLA